MVQKGKIIHALPIDYLIMTKLFINNIENDKIALE